VRLAPATLAFLSLPPLLWASNAVIGRIAVGGPAPLISPLALNTLRWAAAIAILALLVPVVVGRPTAAQRAAIRSGWKVHALLGALSVASYNALQYAALQTSSAINVTLIAAGGPLFTLLVGRLWFRAHAPRWAWIGSALSLLGVVVVLTQGDPGRLARFALARGDLLMVAATFVWALYSWLLRTRRPDLPPLLLLALQAVWGVALSVPVVALEAAAGGFVLQPQWRTLAAIVWVAIGPSIVAYLCWDRGVAHAGPVLPAFFANMTPLLAALMSTALLGEPPHLFHALAFALIAGGIAVSQRGARAA
jgi:drug/metabolite transporter (DMT)-like permease